MFMVMERDDLSGTDIRALLVVHLHGASENSPQDSDCALGLDALKAPNISFWSARDGKVLLGCGALLQLSPRHGEIKSMHVDSAHRGRGIGAFIMAHLLATAKNRGYERVSLETGNNSYFAPACALYKSFDFKQCPPFASYEDNGFSICMTLVL